MDYGCLYLFIFFDSNFIPKQFHLTAEKYNGKKEM